MRYFVLTKRFKNFGGGRDSGGEFACASGYGIIICVWSKVMNLQAPQKILNCLTIWNVKSVNSLNNERASCLDKRPFGEIHSHWVSQEIPLLLRDPGCQYLIYESSHRAPYSVGNLPHHLSKMNFNTDFSTYVCRESGIFPYSNSTKTFLFTLDFFYEFYVFCPSHILWFDHFQRRVIMSTDYYFIIMKCSSASPSCFLL